MTIWLQAILDLIIVILLLSLGWLMALRFGLQDRFLRLALAFPLGAGFLTWALFLLSWAGVPFNRISIAVTYALLSIPLFYRLSAFMAKRGPDFAKRDTSDHALASVRKWIFRFALLSILLLFFSAAFISLGRSYSSWDAIAIWSVKGYGIALEESIQAGRVWGGHNLSYPLNLPLLIGIFRSISGDQIPGSKIVFPLFWGSILLATYRFLVHQGVAREKAMLGVGIIGSTPVVFDHATIGLANLPLASYLVVGTILIVEGSLNDNLGTGILGGILLGLGAWTRVEGILYVMAIMVAIAVARVLVRLNTSWLFLAVAAIPIVIIAGAWLIFYRANGLVDSQLSKGLRAAWDGIQQGQFHLASMRLMIGYLRRSLFDPETWGFLVTISLILLMLSARRMLIKRPPETVLMLTAAMFTAFITGSIYFLVSYVTSDYLAWLERDFPRAFLPAGILFGLSAMLSLRGSDNRLEIEGSSHMERQA